VEKRNLLYGAKTTAAARSAFGAAYLQSDRVEDALDFFEQAKDLEALRGLKARALEEGDAFVLARFERIAGLEVTAEEWQRAARAASQAEQWSQARRAYEKAGLPEEAQKAAERMAAALKSEGGASTPPVPG